MSFLVRKLFGLNANCMVSQLTSSLRTISFKNSSLATIPQQNKINEVQGLEVLKNINHQLENQTEGRLFAIVQLCGKQFKITQGDIILVEGYWPPTIGDKIRLDKVLLAGSNDFTLIGSPILKPGICDVEATIIEKTLSHTKTHFKKKRRKQYKRINFYRSPNTMIRINSIGINIINDNESKDVRIF